MEVEALVVRQARRYDARWMDATFAGSLLRREGYFEDLCLQQAAGLLALLVAERGAEVYAGHVRVHWESAYGPFREAGIPEIMDLFVAPNLRRQGMASALLEAAEGLIAARAAAGECKAAAGLAVGLYKEYGPAQRLYVRRGYVPDGRGAHYRDRPIRSGQVLPFDEEAVLYLVKELSAGEI